MTPLLVFGLRPLQTSLRWPKHTTTECGGRVSFGSGLFQRSALSPEPSSARCDTIGAAQCGQFV